MDTFIILVPTSCYERQAAESLLDDVTEFKDCKDGIDVFHRVKDMIKPDKPDMLEDIEIYYLDEFVEMCNDECFNVDTFWVSYVNIKGTVKQ